MCVWSWRCCAEKTAVVLGEEEGEKIKVWRCWAKKKEGASNKEKKTNQ